LFMATSNDELAPRLPPTRLDDSKRNVTNGSRPRRHDELPDREFIR
jgi:hypothetical protein